MNNRSEAGAGFSPGRAVNLRSVRGRIFVSVALVFVILAIIAAGALWLAVEHSRAIKRVEAASLEASYLEAVATNGAATILFVQFYVETEQQAFLVLGDENRASTLQALDDALAVDMEHDGGSHAQVIEELIVRADELSADLARIVDLVEAGELEDARAIQAGNILKIQEFADKLSPIIEEKRMDIAHESQLADRVGTGAVYVLIIGGVLGLALVLTLGYVIGRSIVRPLEGLQATALDLAGGNLTVRADEKGLQEIAAVGASFNVMTEELLDASKRAQLIAERERAFEALAASEEKWRSLVQTSPGVILQLDLEGRVTFINQEQERFAAEQAVGSHYSALFDPDSADVFEDAMNTVLQSGNPVQAEVSSFGDGAKRVWYLANVGPIFSGDGVIGVSVVATDITKRKEAEEQIAYLAYHDALTGLANRSLFRDRFDIALAQARRSGAHVCVLSLDIDRFKYVNDTLGHTGGDHLLRAASERLQWLVRDGDTVARVGGDEFLILVNGYQDADAMTSFCERITDSFRKPFTIEGREYHSSVSVGLAIHPEHGSDPETLIRKADVAMYAVKEAGRDGFRIYSTAIESHGAEWLALETDLRSAVQNDAIEVHYQPQVSIASGRIVGVEALARWRHPRHGYIAPAEFIPLAEERGMIVELGEKVLRIACQEAAGWTSEGLEPVRIAVNVSPRQFHQVRFVDTVTTVLAETGLSPERLNLEITESTALRDIDVTREVTRELASRGIRLSVDDFGAGTTSLRYLPEFSVDALKIDQSFVRDMLLTSGSAAIATSVIRLGKQLNLTVIAEGVETQEQLAFLASHGCDEYQGFLFGPAVPATAVRQLLPRSDDVVTAPSD